MGNSSKYQSKFPFSMFFIDFEQYLRIEKFLLIQLFSRNLAFITRKHKYMPSYIDCNKIYFFHNVPFFFFLNSQTQAMNIVFVQMLMSHSVYVYKYIKRSTKRPLFSNIPSKATIKIEVVKRSSWHSIKLVNLYSQHKIMPKTIIALTDTRGRHKTHQFQEMTFPVHPVENAVLLSLDSKDI